MNSQLTLLESTLSIFIGYPPSQDDFAHVKHAYTNSSFRQVVFVDSQNLVQMCNFVRRCRQEKRQGKTFKYLVFLHFIPHRESWHLLNVFRDLNMTLVLYGGVCSNARIHELFDYDPAFLMQWYKRSTVKKNVPLIFGANLVTRECGVVKTHGELTNINAQEDGLSESLRTWTATVRFDRNDYEKMDGFRATNDDRASSSSSRDEQQRAHSSYSTATMSVALACSTLAINEAESHNLECVKKAFRKRARECHPDKHGGDESAHAQFTLLNEAKTFLENLLAHHSV